MPYAEETLEQRSMRIFGKPLEEVVPQLFSDGASFLDVAKALEAAPNSIRYWLDHNGYETSFRRVIEVKKVQPDA